MTSPGIIEIARRAGVGKSTAARALSGEGSVSERARQKVLAAAAAVKYRANTAARSLRRGENRLLGLVVPESNSVGFLSHAISAQKLEGIAVGAKRHGYDLQIFIENLQDMEALHRLAVGKDVSGFFLLGHVERKLLDTLKRYRIPWIGVNWQHPDRPDDPHCWTDFTHAGRSLIGHLCDIGCRRVVAFDWLSIDYGPFGAAVRAEWKKRGMPTRDLIVHTGLQFTGGKPVEEALAQAFAGRAKPEGILLSHEDSALTAYRFLAERDIRPGRDIAVANFDDIGIPRMLDPPCTCYFQPFRQMGETAVAEMDLLLRDGSDGTVKRELPGRLEIRPSTALFTPR